MIWGLWRYFFTIWMRLKEFKSRVWLWSRWYSLMNGKRAISKFWFWWITSIRTKEGKQRRAEFGRYRNHRNTIFWFSLRYVCRYQNRLWQAPHSKSKSRNKTRNKIQNQWERSQQWRKNMRHVRDRRRENAERDTEKPQTDDRCPQKSDLTFQKRHSIP